MGADGGLEFLSLKQPNKYKRLCELVGPFRVLYLDKESAASNVSQDACAEYLYENPEFNSDKYLIGMHGTDLPGLSNFEDLLDIIENIEKETTFHDFGIYPEKDTFLDLFLEKETRPDTVWGWVPVVENILKVITYGGFYKYNDLKDNLILKMTLKSWKDEVVSILDVNSYFSVQTWT